MVQQGQGNSDAYKDVNAALSNAAMASLLKIPAKQVRVRPPYDWKLQPAGPDSKFYRAHTVAPTKHMLTPQRLETVGMLFNRVARHLIQVLAYIQQEQPMFEDYGDLKALLDQALLDLGEMQGYLNDSWLQSQNYEQSRQMRQDREALKVALIQAIEKVRLMQTYHPDGPGNAAMTSKEVLRIIAWNVVIALAAINLNMVTDKADSILTARQELATQQLINRQMGDFNNYFGKYIDAHPSITDDDDMKYADMQIAINQILESTRQYDLKTIKALRKVGEGRDVLDTLMHSYDLLKEREERVKADFIERVQALGRDSMTLSVAAGDTKTEQAKALEHDITDLSKALNEILDLYFETPPVGVNKRNWSRGEMSRLIGNARQRLESASKAMNADVNGGIDFDRAKMQMNVNKEGLGVNMQFDPAMIERMRTEGFDGFEFRIETITPITNLPLLLGVLQ